jgi:hypothetical protein
LRSDCLEIVRANCSPEKEVREIALLVAFAVRIHLPSKVLNKKGADADGSEVISFTCGVCLASITSYAQAQWSDLVDAEEKID